MYIGCRGLLLEKDSSEINHSCVTPKWAILERISRKIQEENIMSNNVNLIEPLIKEFH